MSAFGGLDLCACKRGFFTLRDCANPATGDAARCCSRRICDAAPRRRAGVCVECAAKRDEDRALDEPLDHAGDPTLGAVRYRTRWYRSQRLLADVVGHV